MEVLPPFSCVHGPFTKLFKVLRGYFQSLPCTFSGSGEKVNEFNTVSHDSPYSGHSERWRCTGLQQHADEGAASRGECRCPLKVEISRCKTCMGSQSEGNWGDVRFYLTRYL